jgi:hypothetical protein
MVAKGEQRFNILHPITAIMIVSGQIPLDKPVTAVIYRYQIKRDIDEDNSNLYGEKIQELCVEVMNNKTTPTLSLEPRRSLQDDIRDFAVNSNHEISFRERSSNSSEIIIPVQLATSGLTMPWYGLIHTRKSGGGYSSKNLFPMLSGNVSSPFLASMGSTCTGNHDSSMFSSLYVLNNMNIGSMYFGETVPIDVHTFVDACQEVSIKALNIYAEGI